MSIKIPQVPQDKRHVFSHPLCTCAFAEPYSKFADELRSKGYKDEGKIKWVDGHGPN